MWIRAAIGDEALAATFAAALAAQGVDAQVLTGPDPDDPVTLFLVTPASQADAAFRASMDQAVVAGRGLVAIVEAPPPSMLTPSWAMDLTDWNRTDPRNAAFRQLVQACLRGAADAPGPSVPLGLDTLAAKRSAATRTPAPEPPAPTASASSFEPAQVAPPPMYPTAPTAAAPRRGPGRGLVMLGGTALAVVLGAQLFMHRPESAGPATAAVGAPAPEATPAALPPANDLGSPGPPETADSRPTPAPDPALGSSEPPPMGLAATAPPRRTPWLPILAAGAAALAGGAWLYRRLAGRRSPAAAAPTAPLVVPDIRLERDLVDVSLFAPAAAKPGQTVLVQVFLHLMADAEAAHRAARAADAGAALRTAATLDAEIARGARVDVLLEAGGGAIDEAVQHLTWRGPPRACQFMVTAPTDAADPLPIVARLFVDGVPVGRLAFTLAVAAAAAPGAVDLVTDGEAKRFRQAFLSYSSADRPEVLKRVDALRAAGIGFFQDILSLEPGDEWEARLFAEIDRCDLFLLFWSAQASRSQWVVREAEYAMQRRGASPQQIPDITPIILEGPPPPAPPPSLRSLHFNDVLRYIAFASEEEQRRRAA